MIPAYRFLHLGVNFIEKTPNSDALQEIQDILDKAKDWYRYAPGCWLIYTAKEPKVWHERLKKIPWMAKQRYLIAPIDLKEKSGWLPRDTWQWINKSRLERSTP